MVTPYLPLAPRSRTLSAALHDRDDCKVVVSPEYTPLSFIARFYFLSGCEDNFAPFLLFSNPWGERVTRAFPCACAFSFWVKNDAGDAYGLFVHPPLKTYFYHCFVDDVIAFSLSLSLSARELTVPNRSSGNFCLSVIYTRSPRPSLSSLPFFLRSRSFTR